jgi:hypothetical protein
VSACGRSMEPLAQRAQVAKRALRRAVVVELRVRCARSEAGERLTRLTNLFMMQRMNRPGFFVEHQAARCAVPCRRGEHFKRGRPRRKRP